MTTIRVQGRDLSEADLAEIQQTRAEHPDWSRFQLSVFLAERWQWRNAAGRLKDMAARTLLLKLQVRGLIQLPPPRKRNRRPCAQAPISRPAELFLDESRAIRATLKEVRPVTFTLVQTLEQRRAVHRLLEQYHYRGYNGAVGENVQYLARDTLGRELAVMVFGAAAWKVAGRDLFIGWSDQQRSTRLSALANQQRFLILPWVDIPHLASHLLALATRRLAEDWLARYGQCL